MNTETKHNRLSILAAGVDAVTLEQALAISLGFIRSNRSHHILTLNSLYALDTLSNPSLADINSQASLSLADSYGIVWAVKMLHGEKIELIPGIDFAFELCDLAEKERLPVFLLGGEDGVAETAQQFLKSQFPALVMAGVRSGFFKNEQEQLLIDTLHASRPKIILVGLGMPKQEIWISSHLHQLPPGLYLGIGGSFDVWAGHLKRAPYFMRKLGLEWLFRLFQEPFRWSRILRLPWFAWKIFLKKYF